VFCANILLLTFVNSEIPRQNESKEPTPAKVRQCLGTFFLLDLTLFFCQRLFASFSVPSPSWVA
jgi:hypothetical protein